MALLKVHFLPVETSLNIRSTRQRELTRAEALSHAATTAHRRAGRGKKRIKGGDEDDEAPTAHEQPRASSWCEWQPQQQLHGSRPLQIKTGPLDPFIQLPTSLGPKDRQLLHVYLTLIPRRNYGLKANPSFDPVRDYGIPQFANNATYLQLYLLQAELATGASAPAIYSRRALIYAGMKERVQQPRAFTQDSTLVLLAGWGACESRFGFLDVAQQHFKATLRLIALRGGLQILHRMDPGVGMGLMICLLYQNMPLFETRLSVVKALQRMSLPVGRIHDRRLWRYFGPETQPGGLFWNVYKSQQRGHFWNLYMMNMITEQGPCPVFERELFRLVLGSGPELSSAAMQFAIPTIIAKLGRWQHDKPLVRAWDVVEFVALMDFAAPSRKQEVQCAMSGWLTGASRADAVDMLSLKRSVLVGWEKAHGEEPQEADL